MAALWKVMKRGNRNLGTSPGETFLFRTYCWPFIFPLWQEECGNRAALCMFLPNRQSFRCVWPVFGAPRELTGCHICHSTASRGPCCIKTPMSEVPPALRAALAFEQGLIQNDWTGEEVEGGSSFNVQTLFYNVHRLSSHSVLWLILWATNIKKRRSLEKEEGERVSKWRISLHFWAHAWSAFLAIFPQVIHSPCLHYGSAMHFTKKKKALRLWRSTGTCTVLTRLMPLQSYKGSYKGPVSLLSSVTDDSMSSDECFTP